MFVESYCHLISQGWRNERIINMPSTGGGRIVLVVDGDPPAHKNKVYINFSFLDLMGEVFYMLILTFGHYWELLIRILWFWQVHEVVKIMEVEFGGGWIFHKNCKVINIKFYLVSLEVPLSSLPKHISKVY